MHKSKELSHRIDKLKHLFLINEPWGQRLYVCVECRHEIIITLKWKARQAVQKCRHLDFIHTYLDHGDKRHDSLHVFLQFRQGSQFTCYHFVVWKGPIVALYGAPQQNRVDSWTGDRGMDWVITCMIFWDRVARIYHCITTLSTPVRLPLSTRVWFSPCNACRAEIRHCVAMEGSSWRRRWCSGTAWLAVLSHPSIGQH